SRAHVASASLPRPLRAFVQQPGDNIALSRLLGDVERRLCGPGCEPVEIGAVREQILRGGELAAMAGVPEWSRQLLAAEQRIGFHALLDELQQSERGFVPELGLRAARDQRSCALPLSVADGAGQR